ncbi:alpha/beta hydrolase [bacterium SCSIO 12696]|nr:alpha/beta hydrolase [bacterium SCSIO 12696]
MCLRIVIGIFVGALVACTCSSKEPSDEKLVFTPAVCEVGLYELGDEFVAVTRRDNNFRYSYSDGRWGKVNEDVSFECGDNSVRTEGSRVWKKRSLQITDTTFDANGVALAGQLIEPLFANAETPLVVLAHGSEELGWIEAASYPYQLVGRGVSVFVYDKRGTGKSKGIYSQNFPRLADDLVAASQEAKRLAKHRFKRFGLLGFSQGGWIAPLAADRTGADFIGVGYGLVVDILEEDASQVALELREAGYGSDVIAKAKGITDVTARLAVSGYQDGLNDLDSLRKLYADEEWFPMIRGGFTGVILGISSNELREKGIPMFDRLDIDWSVKPMKVLREVDVPQLWALAEDDREAPISTTLDRLQILRSEKKDITVFVFPKVDHGMWEYEQQPDGSRYFIRVTDKYYDLMADWSKGVLKPPYAGSSEH